MERPVFTPRPQRTHPQAPVPSPAAAEVRRVPFNVVDELIHHLDSPGEPWTVQVEAETGRRLDEARLGSAIATALARHPMARARRGAVPGWHRQLVWEITPHADHDVLQVADCPDEAALAAARARFYSEPVSLAVAPPLRVQLARQPAGDRVMLSVHHAASDGL